MTTRADRGWDLLLLCVAAYIATAVGRVHQLFPVLLMLKPTLLAGGAAIALYLLQATGSRRPSLLRMPPVMYLAVLLVWVALSVPGALYAGLAFELLVDNFIKTVLLFLLIVVSVRGVRDVERLALVYFVSAAVYAAVVLSTFDVASGGANWRLSNLYFYDANDFATLAVSALPLGLYFAIGQQRWGGRFIGALGLLALLLAFIWSGSRGGFLALLAVAAFVLVGYGSIAAKWRILGVAALTAIMLATAGDEYWTQMRTIVRADEDYNRTAEEGRWQIWRRGIGYMLQHPVFGVGASNFPVAEGTLSPQAERQNYGIGVRWSAAHNSFVQIGAELGVAGLAIFLLLIGSTFLLLIRLLRIQRADSIGARGPPQLTQALMCSLIGFLVGAFFLSLAYAEMLYTLLALATGLAKCALAPARPRAAPSYAWAPKHIPPANPDLIGPT